MTKDEFLEKVYIGDCVILNYHNTERSELMYISDIGDIMVFGYIQGYMEVVSTATKLENIKNVTVCTRK